MRSYAPTHVVEQFVDVLRALLDHIAHATVQALAVGVGQRLRGVDAPSRRVCEGARQQAYRARNRVPGRHHQSRQPAPRPTAAGVFGMARTMAVPGGNAFAINLIVRPAMIDSTSVDLPT